MKNPSGVERAGREVRGDRFSLIGWTDAEKKERKKNIRERGREREKNTQGKSALCTHKQIHHQLWQTTRRITMSLSAPRKGG